MLQGRPCRNKVQTRSREQPGTGFQAEVWLAGLCMGAQTPHTHTHPGLHQSGDWARGSREAAISTGTGETGHSLLLLTFEHATAYLTTPLGYLGISNLTHGNQILFFSFFFKRQGLAKLPRLECNGYSQEQSHYSSAWEF